MQLFRRILCPVDFSEFSFLALRYARALASENEAHLTLFHTVPDLAQAMNYIEGNYISTVNEVLLSNASERLEELIADLAGKQISTSTRVGTGSPTQAILDAARDEKADLIVMGTHGFAGQDPYMVGSVTNKVLHKSVVPVLVVCKPSHHFIKESGERPIEIKKILCAVDFEPITPRIRDLALSIGRLYQSEVFFFHVTPRSETVNAEEMQNISQAKLRELINPEQEDWCKVRFVSVSGDPATEIIRNSESMEIDLVVMGHHTRKPIEEVLLGSVAKRVVADNRCPALVVRTRSAIFP